MEQMICIKCYDVVAMKNDLPQIVFGTLTNLCLAPINGTLANSVDPDQTQKTRRLIKVNTVFIKYMNFCTTRKLLNLIRHPFYWKWTRPKGMVEEYTRHKCVGS